MAAVEDAATVLEDFVQNVANLPAEIQHLLEEIQAKDHIVQECRAQINTRDAAIQRWTKANGCADPSPKEEAQCKVVLSNFDQACAVQEEKMALSERAATLLDRQVRRLDFKIRDLQAEGAIPADLELPTLLDNTRPPRPRVRNPPSNTHANAAPSTTIANAPIQRLVQPASHHPTANPSPVPAPAKDPANSRTASPEGQKRRRLNSTQPTTSLRQSSIGPASTVQGAVPQDPPTQTAAPARPPAKKGLAMRVMPGPNGMPVQRVDRKAMAKRTARQHSGAPTKEGAGSGGESENVDVVEDEAKADEEDGSEEEGEGEGDDRKYCTCHSVSFGNMVACDNDECPFEWFHWSCVGVCAEPKGKWFCPECRKR